MSSDKLGKHHYRYPWITIFILSHILSQMHTLIKHSLSAVRMLTTASLRGRSGSTDVNLERSIRTTPLCDVSMHLTHVALHYICRIISFVSECDMEEQDFRVFLSDTWESPREHILPLSTLVHAILI